MITVAGTISDARTIALELRISHESDDPYPPDDGHDGTAVPAQPSRLPARDRGLPRDEAEAADRARNPRPQRRLPAAGARRDADGRSEQLRAAAERARRPRLRGTAARSAGSPPSHRRDHGRRREGAEEGGGETGDARRRGALQPRHRRTRTARRALGPRDGGPGPQHR